MALDTVQQYVDRARVLLQDTVEPYRYTDDELVEALNLGVMEARRLRPDLFLGVFASLPNADLPEFSTADTTEEVEIDRQYRVAFLYYMCGHAQLRDEENTQDARAAVFLNKFVAQLQEAKA